MGYFLGTIGDDTIEGSDGDDYLYGGPNGDRYSGEGRDTLFGYGGNDFYTAGRTPTNFMAGSATISSMEDQAMTNILSQGHLDKT